jgi:uncharacterized protein YjlB
LDDRTQEVEVREHLFEDDGRIPNNSELPLLFYPQVCEKDSPSPSGCKELLVQHGWRGTWVNGVFSYHHYHSTSHEVLIVVGGEARLTFGGPEGETIEVEAGDAVVIPAGVGHCNEDSSSDFSVIGAYPRGQESYDLRTGEEGERPEVLENIRKVSLPETDPLFGEEGPLLRYWSK